ncbi:MAG: MATE family efflux transporter [Paludibacteraceae bacterium]|nr:MATE family efflux transporter [Paludibacteraceae bacterium]
MSDNYRKIFKIAIPSIATNISVPLLGFADMAIAGHIGAAPYIAAVTLGAAMISLLYWNFGFLRMSTTALTAQALGARKLGVCCQVLVRALVIAMIGAAAILLIKGWIIDLVLSYSQASAETEELTSRYINICLLGAPASLATYTFKGWLVGMQNTKSTMYIAVGENMLNVLLSAIFVFACGFGIEGIALGTVVAQYLGTAFCLYIYFTAYKRIGQYADFSHPFDGILSFFKVNSLIFVRNLCMIAVTVCFTLFGSGYGELVLAVNACIMQFFTFFSYFMDGFAFAGEAIVGKTEGARQMEEQRRTVQQLFNIGIVMAISFAIIYGVGLTPIVSMLTDDVAVRETSKDLRLYATLIPIMSFAAFLWDGIYVGKLLSKHMSISLLLAAAVFFTIYYTMSNTLGSDVLWIAFLSYAATRSLYQTVVYLRKTEK